MGTRYRVPYVQSRREGRISIKYLQVPSRWVASTSGTSKHPASFPSVRSTRHGRRRHLLKYAGANSIPSPSTWESDSHTCYRCLNFTVLKPSLTFLPRHTSSSSCRSSCPAWLHCTWLDQSEALIGLGRGRCAHEGCAVLTTHRSWGVQITMWSE